jgi:hypothetical protein
MFDRSVHADPCLAFCENSGILEAMTTKERLHELIDQLDDASAERLLSTAETIVPASGEHAARGLPSFVGAFASGRSDTSARAEEFLRDELGAA